MVLASATLAGPGWAARPDDRAGMLGVGAISAETEKSLRPDDRGTARGPGYISIVALEYRATQASEATRPDDRDGVRGPGAVATPTTISAPTADDDGFPWAEVGMGAALIAFTGLLGTALVINGRYHRRPA
jgi:hypothetical protein